jgi:hypothetical protein
LPPRKTGNYHLVSPTVSSIRVTGAVTNYDGKVRFRHKSVALDNIAHLVCAEIAKVRGFGIIIHEAAGPEFIYKILAKIPIPFFQRIFPVQPHGAEQRYVFELRAPLEKLLYDHGYGHTTVTVMVNPSLNPIRESDNYFLVRATQLFKGRKFQGIFKRLSGDFMGIDLWWILIGLAVTDYERRIWKRNPHMRVSII